MTAPQLARHMQAALPAVNVFRQLQAAAPTLVPSLRPAEACSLLAAFARAGLYCPQLVDLLCEHHVGEGCAWAPYDARQALWAIATMGTRAPRLLEHAIDCLHAHARSAPPGSADVAPSEAHGVSANEWGPGLEGAADSSGLRTPTAALALFSAATSVLVHRAEVDDRLFQV
jgi:hypothetical protein